MISKSAARVADAVAREVRAVGVDWAFGHPGGEVVILIDALRRSGINFLLTRHEASAAFAAGGYAELTGRPGVCVATLGPGATNLVTGVASAFLERAPILAFTGSLAESTPAGTTHQRLPLQEMFTAVAKKSVHLTDENPAAVVRDAIATAGAERPGPVHLSLAADVASRPARPESGPAPSGRQSRQSRQQVNQAHLDRARKMLAASSRTAIVAGLTAARVRAEEGVRRFAAATGAPVALTPKAKGLVPEDDAQFLGVIDMAGDEMIADFLDRADLIVAVGCDVVELDRRWTWAAPVIHVDELPNADEYYRAEAELIGPISQTLALLTDGATRGVWGLDEVAQRRREILDYVRPHFGRLQPWQVVESVQSHAGSGALATCDVGAHKMLVGQLWRTDEPRQFFMANGLSSMGYSIPTALAAHLVNPLRRVIAFVGDGGLGMYLGELETLVRARARLTLIVFADRSLELIRRAELRRDVSTESVTFANPDFGAIGRAFGLTASEASTEQELEKALVHADRGLGVHLVAARIDGSDYRL